MSQSSIVEKYLLLRDEMLLTFKTDGISSEVLGDHAIAYEELLTEILTEMQPTTQSERADFSSIGTAQSPDYT